MVHLRGHRADYDRWAESGGAGWSYDAMLPHFKRSETVPDGDPAWRGQDGPMRPSQPRHGHPMSAAFVAAAAAAGWPVTADFNGAQPEGAGWQDAAILDGRRQSVADAYLTPVRGPI
jgi:choline dehydrogenase